jgi:U4/U6 small nuclear ribonucleoprotein PRP4
MTLATQTQHTQATAAARDSSEATAKRYAQQSSEIADDRPVGGCAFSPDGQTLAACGWGGAVNLWLAGDGADLARVRGFRAHAERATGIAWHPQAALTQVRGGGGGGGGCLSVLRPVASPIA